AGVGAVGASVTDRADACVIGACDSLRTSLSSAGLIGGVSYALARFHPTCVQGGQMIPTEPIGSIPRPKSLIDGQAAFAEGTISPEELRALQDEALADTIQ